MAIEIITKGNIEKYAELLPDWLERDENTVIGYMEEVIPCATAVMEETERCWMISWLWVEPEYRSRGIGTAMLEALCMLAEKKGKKQIRIIYSADEEWTLMMEAMLFRKGFLVNHQEIPKMIVTEEWFSYSEIFRKQNVKRPECAYLFKDVPKYLIGEFMERCEINKNYLVDRDVIMRADENLSTVLVKNGTIEGIALIENLSEEGIYELSLLYLSPKALRESYSFFRYIADVFRESVKEFKELRMFCVNETSKNLAANLLNINTYMAEIGEGILAGYLL